MKFNNRISFEPNKTTVIRKINIYLVFEQIGWHNGRTWFPILT